MSGLFGHDVPPRWENQQEALEFAMRHPACMLDMEMGTGKTRVAIEAACLRSDVHLVLVVCPKAVMSVWPKELEKYCADYTCIVRDRGWSTTRTRDEIERYLRDAADPHSTNFIVINYEASWRDPMKDLLLHRARIDMVILDESHRAKSAGSRVSKFMGVLGRRVKYRMCLSGTPMANSPLDVYGQYRFLDPSIYDGLSWNYFQQRYAVMGGPEHRFVVGYRNQQDLMNRFRLIAYTCHMSDIADRIKLPDALPPTVLSVEMPAHTMRTIREFQRDFVAESGHGVMTASNVLVQILRMQQLTSGLAVVQEDPTSPKVEMLDNTAKQDALQSVLEDIGPEERAVVFCRFVHDLKSVHNAAEKSGRGSFELSGAKNEVEEWRECAGAVLAVQIGAGAEGIDLTCSRYAVYMSLPHSLAQYEQSRARLYRPGQQERVLFLHIVAQDTVDEAVYSALMRKRNILDAIEDGSFDFGFITGQ